MATGDVTQRYAADSQPTISLSSLATSATLVAGRQSAAVFNSTVNNYLDYDLSGKIGVSTSISSTAASIEVWVIRPINDTPTWPDTFGAADAAVTVTSRDMLASYGKLAAAISPSTVQNLVYPFEAGSVASLFGGICPHAFAVWVTQNTGVILSTVTGNHEISVQGVYENIST